MTSVPHRTSLSSPGSQWVLGQIWSFSFPTDIALVLFLALVANSLTRSSFRQERFALAHSLKSMMVKKPWEREVADRITARKQSSQKTGQGSESSGLTLGPTSSGKAPSPKDSTTFQTDTTNWSPSVQTYMSQWGTFHIQNTEKNRDENCPFSEAGKGQHQHLR